MQIDIKKEDKKAKQLRIYRKVTPELIADFVAERIRVGNGTKAIRKLEPDQKDPARRAWLLSMKANELKAGEYIESRLEQIGLDAVERLGELVNSHDEQVAQRSTHFAIEHQVGKAVQRSETKAVNYNIEAVLQ